jgi:hypothetical protein
MYYHPVKKLVFLAQPHTGSHSVAYALLHHGFQLGNNSVAVVGNELRRPYHHADLWEGGHVTQENRKDWTVFSTVRNHYDLVLSRAWKYANFDPDWKAEEKWFRQALQFNWWVKPTTLFGKFRPDSDRLLRYESLERHLKQTVGPMKLPEIHKNPARKGRPYQEFYTPSTRAMVEDRYRDEIEELGYDF